MFKIAIVIFREFLEITILLSIITAATRQITKSKLYITFGIILGVLASIVLAFFFKQIIIHAFDGMGDEIFNLIVICITVLVLSLTIAWMRGHSSKIFNNFTNISSKINNGIMQNIILVLLVAFTMLRESMEIILFLHSVTSVQIIDTRSYLLGFSIGGVLGMLFGAVIYYGLIKLAGRYIFKVSSIMLALIAAALAAEAAGVMTSSGIIDIMSDQLWDSSWLISDYSITGKILNIVIGYNAKPNGMQIIFYICTICLIILLSKLKNKLS